MTLNEKIIVSTYTGYLMCDFDLVHTYIEKVMGRPVWTHEIGEKSFNDELMKKVKPDFLKICADEEVHVDLEGARNDG
nr:MAG TPA: hypothetical protein [Caudoviricetes sp.]